VSEVAKSILNNSIYPSQEEFSRETEKIVSERYPEFYTKYRTKWTLYYEKNIYQRVNMPFFLNITHYVIYI
jgi:hypothetical protein